MDPNTYTGDIYYLDMTKAETMTVKEYDAQKLEAEKLEYLKTRSTTWTSAWASRRTKTGT